MDEALLLWINQGWAHPWLDVFFTWVSQRETFSFPLLGVILVLSVLRFRGDGLRLWLVLIVVIGVADLTGNMIKKATAQPRPCYEIADQVRQPTSTTPGPCGANLTGMPSNHAMNFFAATLFLVTVLRIRGATLTLVAIAAAVSISRIYLGDHYPGQVIVGIVLGSLIGFVAARAGLKYLSFIQRIRHAHTG
jgi:undecaprenyl-diphosphatase